MTEDEAPLEHIWFRPSWAGYDVCRRCCRVKRKDGLNNPCRVVRLSLRADGALERQEPDTGNANVLSEKLK